MLFFRTVASKYKKKKYQYLRLMESYRDGDKVKQKELMTLANLTQTPANKINDILDDLRQLITISSSLSSYTGGSAHLSLILALETAFQPKKICPVTVLEETISREREKKEGPFRDSELFFRLLKKYHAGQPGNSDLIFWANKAGIPGSVESTWIGYLMNSAGFPLQYFLFEKNGNDTEKLTNVLAALKRTYKTEPIWIFLPTYFNQASPFNIIYPDGYTQTSVVICQQRTNWVEYPAFSAEQYTVFTDINSAPPEKARELINITSNFLKYFRWYNERINLVTDEIITEEDFLDMCIMTHLFGRLIELNIGVKNLLPVREKYKNAYKYVPEKEPPASMSQQFSQLND